MAIYNKFPANSVSLRTIGSGTVSYDLAMRDTHTIDLDPEFHALDEAVPGARILGLLTKLGSPKVVKAPIYFMLRKRQLPRFINLTDSYTTGTTVTVGTTAITKLKVGYHVMNSLTREILRIVSIDAGAGTFVVERQVGEAAQANSVSTDDELVILYYRGAAGDVKFLDFVRVGDVIYNYIGKLQKSYGIEDYELDTGHLPGHDPLAVLRMDKLQEMRLDLEWAILLEQRSKKVRTSDGRIVWTPGGIDAFATENETDFNGSIDEDKIVAAARAIKRHGPNDRWVFAAPLFMQKLNLALGKVANRLEGQVVPSRLGLNIKTYEYGGLNLHFVEQPLLDDAGSAHANSLKGHAYGIDPDDIDLVTMRGQLMGFFKWNLNVEQPGTQIREDQLLTAWGLRMRRPEHYFRWYNVGA